MSDDYREADQYVYVRACGWEGDDRKRPTTAWVNADDAPGEDNPQECRSLDNPHTLSYEETDKDEPHIIVGAVDGYCLDIDIDVGEDHEETFGGDVDDIHTPRGALAFLSASGGPHRMLKFKQPLGNLTPATGVDLQGDMDGNKGVVTSPFHHPEYEITNEPAECHYFDGDLTSDDASLNNGFNAELFVSAESGETEAGGSDSKDAKGGFEAGKQASDGGERDENDDYDEYLTDDDIADALSNIPRDLSYNEWMRMAYGVHDYDDSENGRRLFVDWSKPGRKWDSDSKEWLDKFWNQADNGSGRARKTTLGSLIHVAELRGWEKPTPGDVGLIEKDGGYGYYSDVSSDDEPTQWRYFERTNFTFELNAILELDDGARFDINVVPANGQRYQVQVEPTVFNEMRTFKREIVTGTSTTVSEHAGDGMLNDLRLLLHNQDAPRLEGVTRLGIHDDEFVTPDGVLTAEGWTDNPGHVFVDDGNPLTTALDIPDDGDGERVARALELLPQTRDPELFIPVVGWHYATAFRPFVRDETGQFNHLAVFGETGAGKTMTTSALSQMFGMAENGFNPLDTAFVSLRTLSAGRGLPIWYDEYKPAEWDERGRRQFHADLRKAAAGQWARRGNADKSTDGYFLSAPVMLTGEQHLQGSAEQRRTIQTRFSTDATESADRQTAYYELRDECDLRGHARLFYQWVLGLDNETVREWWTDAGEEIEAELPVAAIDDLAQQGLQTVLFGMDIYQRFADELGASVPELPVWDSLRRLCDETGSDSRTSHIDEFVTLLGRAAVNGYLEEDIHYTFVDDELRINVSRSHDRVSKFIRDHDLTGVDIFDSASDYTARFRDSEADWLTCVQQNSPPVSRAVGFDTEACPLIERSAFDDEAGADEEKRAAEVDISPIEDLNGGFATITARVNDVERPEPQNAPTQAGRLVDQTGPVNFVNWRGAPFDLAPDEHYRFENVEVGEYEGNTQVELVEGITNVEAVAAGVGHTEGHGEPLQGERLRAVRDTIGTLCARDDGAEHARREDILNIAGEQGLDESQTEHALDKLSNQGDIYQPAGTLGQYRLND